MISRFEKAGGRPNDGTAEKSLLTKRELMELSSLSSFRSSLHIVAEWALVLAAIYICRRFWNPWLYVMAILVIASRQHALMILLHEGAHYRLFRSRTLNDWVSEILLGWPVLVSARAYRRNHLAHHQHLNTDRDPDWARKQNDPDWVFPKRLHDLAALLIRDISGVGAIVLFRLIGKMLSKDAEVTKRFLLVRYGFYVAAIFLVTWTSSVMLVLLYWFVPLFTWLIFIFRIRSIAEHSALSGRSEPYAQTRTTVPSLLERLLIAPKNVGYHLEHHLYPSVPFYRLPKLHALLMATPAYREAHVTRGYLGVMKECIGDPEASSRPEDCSALNALTFDSGVVRGSG